MTHPSSGGPGPSLRPADLRLLANGCVDRVQLVGCGSLQASFEAAGVEVVEERPDLVVATTATAVAAARLAAPCTIVLGDARRRLRGEPGRRRLVLLRGDPDQPRLLVPLDQPDAARRALFAPIPGRSRAKQLVARATVQAQRLGIPTGRVITVLYRGDDRPAFLAAAQSVGLPPEVTWHLLAGEGDDLQRLVWLCAPPGAVTPSWAVKASRVPDYRAPFDRDEQALGWVQATPEAVRAHAPRFLGRVQVGPLHGSVETAAAGVAMHDVLRRSEAPLELVRAIARWAINLAVATTGPADSLVDELDRLEHQVLPAWAAAGVDPGLVRRLPPLRPVGQHGDLGLWNLVGSEDTWTVVDWESARAAGLPLWDVAYFATDALAHLDDPTGGDERKVTAMIDLLRGEHRWSGVLFDLVGEAAEACEVPRPAVGPVITLGWLHHGTSAQVRVDQQLVAGAAGTAPAGILTGLAARWMADERMGPAWPAFDEPR